MTRPRKIMLGLAVVLITAAGLLAWRSRSTEPEFQQVPLSRWMARYVLRAGSASEEKKVLAAFRGMGAEAVNYLVFLSDAPTNHPVFATIESEGRRELLGGLVYGTNSFRNRISGAKAAPKLDPMGIREEAEMALLALKPDAALLLPHLARAQTNTGPDRTEQLLWLLDSVGSSPERVEPYYLRALADEDEDTRFQAAHAAVNAGLGSPAFVAALMAATEKAPPANRAGMLSLVQLAGPHRSDALPALLRLLAVETNQESGMVIARVISGIDATQTNALDVFFQALARPESRAFALQRLAKLSPRPAVPAPLLAETLRDPQILQSESALMALMSLGPPREIVMPALVKALGDTNEAVRINAAYHLLRLEPNHAASIATLLEAMQASSSPQYRRQAGDDLARAGANASAAIPALKQLVDQAGGTRRGELEAILKQLVNAAEEGGRKGR